MKLTIELCGVDPIDGKYICLSKDESDFAEGEYSHDMFLYLINKVLNDSAKFSPDGLQGLRALRVKLSVMMVSNEYAFRPAFDLDARTISRLNSAGASFVFEPHIYKNDEEPADEDNS
jgi:hypothetical protein